MGWTSYMATHYTKRGTVDRKAEINKQWTQEEHDGSDFNGGTCHYPELKVVKSKMIGSRWYGVIKSTNTVKGTEEYFGEIVLTSTNWSDGMNFGYKDIGSYYSGCNDFPVSWLEMLTPPTDENNLQHFNEWKEECIKYANTPKLKDLPIGTHIKFTDWRGKEHKLFKHKPAYQFKRAFWMYEDCNEYCPAKRIHDWEIVKEV